MRINFTRLGLILMIIGVILLLNFWAAAVPQSSKHQIGRVEPGETLSYSIFMAPVGLGNIVVEGDTLVVGPSYETDGLTTVVFVVPVHLMIVGPSNVTLVDEDIITPYAVQVDFTERGEYTIYVTNIGDELAPIPVSLKFPRDGNVVNREADKFFVSTILTLSGVALFCLGLSTSLIIKRKKTDAKTVNTLRLTFKMANFRV